MGRDRDMEEYMRRKINLLERLTEATERIACALESRLQGQAEPVKAPPGDSKDDRSW